ncbi:MAG: 16S rRNA (cytosine(1402)-N(4))-methyltransferase RsmH [Leptospiraceae bacterium]|nr:16S rRNA (cytosine(1402)-N(4))-methyltransferase RsmH [Leptospiraceae bacterium]
MMEFEHIPVLCKEVLEFFSRVQVETPIFLDGTVGEGGHSLAILQTFPNSKIIAIDRDEEMLERAKQRLKDFSERVSFLHLNFSEFTEEHLKELGFSNLNGILLDFGISTYHIKSSQRGFSFQREEILDMRLSENSIPAIQILNTYTEQELEKIFLEYGEEHWSKKIAQKIVEARKHKKIETTTELNQIVENAIPRRFWPPKVHPAFRIYQALRIESNSELAHIQRGLSNLPSLLASGGLLVAISFHSLEDRIAKQTLKQLAETKRFCILTKKPIQPQEDEVQKNPASRSAKLRAIMAV